MFNVTPLIESVVVVPASEKSKRSRGVIDVAETGADKAPSPWPFDAETL